MFLKAGALSLALLLASRLLGLLRESAQAAAFGTSGLADVVVLMLTLPDWLAGVLAAGALGYVLVPAWAGQSAADVSASQRRVQRVLLASTLGIALLFILLRHHLAAWLVPGASAELSALGAKSMIWSALAVPAAMLAALWTTRLQHERDFTGMYAANLAVNAVLIAVIAWSSRAAPEWVLTWLGVGLLMAMAARLAWLHWRMPVAVASAAPSAGATERILPKSTIWLWAALAAGLPMTLPFAARSIASLKGDGALATFNYAWKLVELPMVLVIQLAASLVFPAVAAGFSAYKQGQVDASVPAEAVRGAFAVAWALACASAAALVIATPALAQLLFGWGSMEPQALSRIANWGLAGAFALLPQALLSVALMVLASHGRMRVAVAAYGAALGLLLAGAALGLRDGGTLMMALTVLLGVVAAACLWKLGPQRWQWLPWRAFGCGLAALLACTLLRSAIQSLGGLILPLALAAGAAAATLGLTALLSVDFRRALRR